MDDAIFSPDRGNEESAAGSSDQPTPFYGGSSNMSQRPGGPILPMSRDQAEEATSHNHSAFESFDSNSGGPFIVPAAAMGQSSQYSNVTSNNTAANSKFREAGLNPLSENGMRNNAGVGAAGGAFARRVPPPSSNSHYSHTSGGSDVAYGGIDSNASGSNVGTGAGAGAAAAGLKSRQPQYAVTNQDEIMQHTDGGPLSNEYNAHQQSELPPTYASLGDRSEGGNAKQRPSEDTFHDAAQDHVETIKPHSRLDSDASYPGLRDLTQNDNDRTANHQRLISQETFPNPYE